MSNKLIYAAVLFVFGLVGCGGGNDQGAGSSNTIGSMAHFVGHIFGPGKLDGAVSNVAFNGPTSVAVDSAGNLYVAEAGNHAIRKITPLGVVSTLAGGSGPGSADGTGAAAQFTSPFGIAVDSAGNVFVADTSNNTIRKISPSGLVETFAGDPLAAGSTDGTVVGGGGPLALFDHPVALAFDSAGDLFVAEQGNSVVRKISIDPNGVLPVGTVTTYASGFNNPYGMAIDSQGNVYVADTNNDQIKIITSPGNVTIFASSYTFNKPASIAIDASDNLYVSDDEGRVVRKITQAEVVTTLAGSNVAGSADGTGTDARFAKVGGMVVSSNTIVAADTDNNNIRKLTLSGTVTTYAGAASESGSNDATGTAARFYFPFAAAYDANGNAYIADRNNHTVRKITAAGVVSTIAGSAGVSGNADKAANSGITALFNKPSGVAVDAAGDIYVSDRDNHRIRKISWDTLYSDWEVTTIAGAGQGSTDATGTNASFNSPEGLALDTAGNLYVADTGNSIIRKITPAAVVTTLAGSPGAFGFANGIGTAARFDTPVGVAVDSSGNLFVTDLFNYAVRKLTPTLAGMEVTTFAGTVGTAGSTNGTGAAARFNEPYGIAIDSAGNLFVADNANSLVRKITTGGVVTTLAGTAGSSGIQMGNLPGVLSGMYGLAIYGTKMLLLVNNGAVLVSNF